MSASADGACVNFGKYNDALNIMAEFVRWEVFQIHCANDRLELSIKDSFKENDAFGNIQERNFKEGSMYSSIFSIIAEKAGEFISYYYDFSDVVVLDSNPTTWAVH